MVSRRKSGMQAFSVFTLLRLLLTTLYYSRYQALLPHTALACESIHLMASLWDFSPGAFLEAAELNTGEF